MELTAISIQLSSAMLLVFLKLANIDFTNIWISACSILYVSLTPFTLVNNTVLVLEHTISIWKIVLQRAAINTSILAFDCSRFYLTVGPGTLNYTTVQSIDYLTSSMRYKLLILINHGSSKEPIPIKSHIVTSNYVLIILISIVNFVIILRSFGISIFLN